MMHDQEKIIKDDINFLEYPTWLINKKKRLTEWVIEKQNGKYKIESSKGLPGHFDRIVIYYLQYRLYEATTFDSYWLKTSRYEIAKNIFNETHFGKNIYTRIMQSLRRWKAVYINFEGVFYEGDGHTERDFSIIDEIILRKGDNELSIRFNEGYIKQLKESKHFKLIDFEKYKILRKDIAARLYEILVKNFKNRNEWAINLQLLASKIPFLKREGAQDYYPSDVLRYLKPGIDEINKKTDLFINFQFNKEANVCIFNKIERKKETYIAAISTKNKEKNLHTKKRSHYLKHFNSLPVNEQTEILDNIKRHQFFNEFLPTQEDKIIAYLSQDKSGSNE